MTEIDDLTQFPAEMSDIVPDFQAFKLESTNHALMNHLVIGFPNGYGMSIIQSKLSYSGPGTWELGIARWHEAEYTFEWELISFDDAESLLGLYDQIVGWQTPADLLDWARRLASLPPQD
jgi:hypothetical protein